MKLSVMCCTILLFGLACGGTDARPPSEPMPEPAALEPAALDLSGTWSEDHATYLAMYTNAADCGEDGGTWEDERGCRFEVSSSITLTPTDDADAWDADISTMGANAHTCTANGTVRRDGDALMFSATDEDACTFPIQVQDGVLSFSAVAEACRYFCGARAALQLSEARRR